MQAGFADGLRNEPGIAEPGPFVMLDLRIFVTGGPPVSAQSLWACGGKT